MPPRRIAKKKGRALGVAAAAESLLLSGDGDAAASPVVDSSGGGFDDGAADDVEADKENVSSNKRHAAAPEEELSRYQMQMEYVENIIQRVEKQGACTRERRREPAGASKSIVQLICVGERMTEHREWVQNVRSCVKQPTEFVADELALYTVAPV